MYIYAFKATLSSPFPSLFTPFYLLLFRNTPDTAYEWQMSRCMQRRTFRTKTRPQRDTIKKWYLRKGWLWQKRSVRLKRMALCYLLENRKARILQKSFQKLEFYSCKKLLFFKRILGFILEEILYSRRNLNS